MRDEDFCSKLKTSGAAVNKVVICPLEMVGPPIKKNFSTSEEDSRLTSGEDPRNSFAKRTGLKPSRRKISSEEGSIQ